MWEAVTPYERSSNTLQFLARGSTYQNLKCHPVISTPNLSHD